MFPERELVNLDKFVQVLTIRRGVHRMCVDFVFFAILLIVVAVSIMWTPHATVDEFMVEGVVNSYLTKDEITGLNGSVIGPNYGPMFNDIISPYLWYSWFESVVLPFYFDAENPTTSYPAGKRLAGGSVPVGPLRLSVLRYSPKSHCFDDPQTDGSPPACLWAKGGSDGTVNRDAYFSYVFEGCEFGAFRGVTSYDQTDYSCEGNVLYIPTVTSFNNATQTFRSLIQPEAGWESNSSRFPGAVDVRSARLVMLRAVTYNIPARIFTTTSMFIQLGTGSNIIPNVHSVSFSLDTDSTLIVHAVMVVTLVVMAVATFVTFTRRGSDVLSEIWNYVWVAALVLTGVYCVFAIIYFSIVLMEVNANGGYLQNGRSEFPVTLDALGGLWSTVNLIRCFAAMVFAVIIVRYISMIPQVQRVANGIGRIYDNIIGLLVLLLCSMGAFSLVGHVLFGQYVHGFQSIPKAFTTLSLGLIGDFDLDNLLRFGVIPAQLFYWSFVLSNLFVLLNFLAATIGSSFEQAREDAGQSEAEDTSPSQHWRLFKSYFTPLYYLSGRHGWAMNHGPVGQVFRFPKGTNYFFAIQYMLHLDNILGRMIDRCHDLQVLREDRIHRDATIGGAATTTVEELAEIMWRLPSEDTRTEREKCFEAKVVHGVLHLITHDEFYQQLARDVNHNAVAVKVFGRELDVDFPTIIQSKEKIAESLHSVAHAADDICLGHKALDIALTRLQWEYREAQLNAAIRVFWEEDKQAIVIKGGGWTTSVCDVSKQFVATGGTADSRAHLRERLGAFRMYNDTGSVPTSTLDALGQMANGDDAVVSRLKTIALA